MPTKVMTAACLGTDIQTGRVFFCLAQKQMFLIGIRLSCCSFNLYISTGLFFGLTLDRLTLFLHLDYLLTHNKLLLSACSRLRLRVTNASLFPSLSRSCLLAIALWTFNCLRNLTYNFSFVPKRRIAAFLLPLFDLFAVITLIAVQTLKYILFVLLKVGL